MTGQLDEAEDLCQEAYLRLYQQLSAGHGIQNPKAWLFQVLRNDLLRQIRARRMETTLHRDADEAELSDPWPTPMPGAAEERIEEIDEMLALLTPREQEVMTLRMASLKYREIAEQLNVSIGSVNQLISRAVRKLQRAAQREEKGGIRHDAKASLRAPQ